MGYSDVGISSLEWGNIIILIRNLKNALNTSSDLNNVFIAGISSSPTLDYQFLDEYLDSVLLLEDREEMITFTEKIYYLKPEPPKNSIELIPISYQDFLKWKL